MIYSDFGNDAVKSYRSLPYETNELYKRYNVMLSLPDPSGQGDSPEGRARILEAVKSIEEKTQMRFDLIVSDNFAKSNHRSVNVIDREHATEEILSGKLFSSAESKLVAYAHAYTGKIIGIDLGEREEAKINALFINDSSLVTQTLVHVGEEGSLCLSEFHVSTSHEAAAAVPLHEFTLSKGSNAEFNLLNNANTNTSSVVLCKGKAFGNAKLRANFVYNGSAATKTLGNFDACGEGSSIDVNEVVYGTGEQKFDISTSMFNSKRNSSVLLESAAVLDGSSYCAMKGFAKVEKWTKGARSKVTERGILLSQAAHIDALPDMSIDYSDEVSAVHSAATAPIDREALFYLESRGIAETEARKLFVSSFISRYLARIGDQQMRELASSVMLSRIDNDFFGEIGKFTGITPKGIWMPSNATE